MGLKFADFPIRGIDVSQFNGKINWTLVNTDFVAIRVGHGRTIDSKFKTNWELAKGRVFRIAYWYMDYYSNHNSGSSAYGISDAEWGKIQADNCWNQIKGDRENYVFLDIENGGSSYSPPITTVTARAQAIAKSFLERMDALNGKINGIYCSLGLLTWFGTWFRNRPLWVAWYNETQTIQTVLNAVKGKGWTGRCLMWQYTSDGDVNDDGIADGISLGMEYKALDLNAWLGTSKDYAVFIGKEAQVELFKVKVLIYNLLVRSGPGMLYTRLRRANFPGEYSIFEEKNGYGRISEWKAEWISMSPDYVQKIGTKPEPTDAEKLSKLWTAHPDLH